MRILFIGDVVGKPGRAALGAKLAALREQHGAELAIVNGENSAGGMGINDRSARDIFAAGADVITKWDRSPTVVRTAVSASQIGHPWGEYMYKELGLRNVTFIAQDYTWGHEVELGMIATYKQAGGKVAEASWLRQQAPLSNLVRVHFANASILEKFGTVTNDKESLRITTKFRSDGSHRGLNIHIVVSPDERSGITEVATPVGVVAPPSTNTV